MNTEFFTIPNKCPVCDSPTSIIGQFLFCKSKSCPVQLTGSVKVWISRLGILHWGEAVIESITNPDNSSVKSIADLYRLDVEDIIPHCSGVKVAEKLYKSLHGSKSITLTTILASLNITNLATSTAADIVDAGYNSIEKIISITEDQLLKIPNIGEITASQIYEGIQNKKDLIVDLSSVLDIKVPNGKLAGCSFCITGSTSRPRKAIEKMIIDAGGSVKGSVGSGTTYLVTNDTGTGSSKLKNAAKHGTKIISEQDLYSIMA